MQRSIAAILIKYEVPISYWALDTIANAIDGVQAWLDDTPEELTGDQIFMELNALLSGNSPTIRKENTRPEAGSLGVGEPIHQSGYDPTIAH